MSRRVSFSPDDDQHHHHKQNYYSNSNRVNLPKCSAAKFFRRIGATVARALRFVTASRKVSSSANLVRSQSYVAQNLDSQRAEAIEDCIEFFNSSASLSRSNSVRN